MSSTSSATNNEQKTDRDEGDAVMSLEDESSSSSEQTLFLVAGDGQRFEVLKKIAIQSKLVKTMVEGDTKETNIPLPNVKGAVLSKVVQYMRYHDSNKAKEIEKPLKTSNMVEVVGSWDADFVDVEQEVLFELILAANYLDIAPLLDLTCAKVASMIKGKTPEAIRNTFNIVNDFTPEEEKAIAAENKWAESD